MNGGVNIWQLVLDASLFVKAVMAILLVFSFLSWVIIFRKRALLSRAMRGADEFEERFWSGADLAGLFREVTSGGGVLTGIESIFEAGFREFARLRQRRQLDARRDRIRIELDRALQILLGLLQIAAHHPRELAVDTALRGERIGMIRVELEGALELTARFEHRHRVDGRAVQEL